MSFKSLFADDEGTGPVPKSKTERPNFRPYQEGDYGELAQAIMRPRQRIPPSFEPETSAALHTLIEVVAQRESPNDVAGQMEHYDRELFEGLFLRYGKAWVSEQMALLLRKFPSYRQG